jgi:hypothetical protein
MPQEDYYLLYGKCSEVGLGAGEQWEQVDLVKIMVGWSCDKVVAIAINDILRRYSEDIFDFVKDIFVHSGLG